MALIGKIRKNSWILVVLIALGLGGFILMDMTSGQQSAFGGQNTTVGEIDGKEVDWNNFYRVEQTLYGNSGGDVYARRDYLWNYFVEETLVSQEAEGLGLGVSKAELLELEFGPRPSQLITQRFANPQQPGVVDRQQLDYIKNLIETDGIQQAIETGQLRPTFPAFWAHQEKEIVKERLESKINGLVSKAMYTPTWMAELGHTEQNLSFDVAYVKVPFDEIDNTDVALADSDYAAYLKKNEKRYTQDEETRKVTYISLDVLPTAQDSAKLEQSMADLVPQFEVTEDDSLFVLTRYGTINPVFIQKEAVPVNTDAIFDAAAGSVVGPFIEQGAYKIVKVLARQEIADSADTRHILISATTPVEFIEADNRVDSLKNVLESGLASFDSLAIRFSQDPGSASNGGKYEDITPNQFVPEYNDVLFVTGEIGKLYKVRTSYGVHLVEVLSRNSNTTPMVKLASISQPIVPSKDTQDGIFEKASATIAANTTLEALLEVAAADDDFKIETSPGLKKNDYTIGALPSDQTSRDIVRWAFNAGINERSADVHGYEDPVENFINKYVLVGLKSTQSAGLPSVESAKEDIENLVMNEKKAEMLKQALQGKDMAAIAAEYELTVDTSNSLRLSQTFVPGIGNEPSVIGKASIMEEGTVSEPLTGNSGVFVVKILRKPTLAQATNIPQIRQSMSSSDKAKVTTGLIQALVKESDVTDGRSKFY